MLKPGAATGLRLPGKSWLWSWRPGDLKSPTMRDQENWYGSHGPDLNRDCF